MSHVKEKDAVLTRDKGGLQTFGLDEDRAELVQYLCCSSARTSTTRTVHKYHSHPLTNKQAHSWFEQAGT